MNFIRKKIPYFPPLLFLTVSILTVGFFLIAQNARAVCTTPVDNLTITSNTTLCTGTYTLTDAGSEGIIDITSSNVTLDCEANTIIRGGGGASEVGIRLQGNATGYTNVTIQNCRIENYGIDIIAGNTSNLTIQNNTLVFISGGKGLQMGANDRTVDTILVTGNTFSGTGNGMSFAPLNTATNVTIQNNTFSSSIDNITLHANGNTSTRFTVSGNTYTTGGGEIISITSSTNTVIQNETIQSGTTSNVLIKDSPGITVRGNNLARSNFQLEGATNGTFDRNFVGGKFNIVQTSTGNTFTNNIVGTDQNWSFRLLDSANNTIRNNTLHGGTNYAVIVDGTSTNTTFKNNSISGYAEVAPAIFVASGSTTGFASDYNIFYGTNGAFTSSWSGITQSTFAAWRTASSQDAHSSLIDPLYTNSSGNDFTLRVTSPAIDAGDPATTTPTADYLQSTRPYGSTGRWDVGAYETSTPVTTNVSLAGTPTYSDVTGNTVSLTITDTSSNPAGTKYAIYESSTAQWLQGNGTGGASPVYSTSTSWTHTNLSANTAYSYDVRTANSGETTITALKGSPVSVTSTLAAPTNLQFSSPSASGVTLTWTAPAGTVTSYDVSYGTTSAASDTVITGVTGTSRAITGLSSSTAYFFKVRANNALGAGAYSAASQTSTLPAAPTNLQASNVTSSSLTLSWTAPSGTVTSYDVSYGTTSAADTTVITGVTTASRAITDLSAGTTYLFKVRATGPGGTGSYSSTLSQATLQETPAAETPDEDEEEPEEDIPDEEEETPETEEPAEPAPSDTEPEPDPAIHALVDLLLVPDAKANGNIRVVNGEGIQRLSFFAFGGQVQMNAITADLRGDGESEIIVSDMSDDAPPHFRIFSHDGELLADLFPYPQNHTIVGGTSISTGDMNGDGTDELAVIPFDNRSHLLLYSFQQSFSDPRVIAQTMIYDAGFRDGSRIDSGDVTGDGRDDLVVWTNDQRPNVQVYSFHNGALIQQAFVLPYAHPLPDGVNIALGDLNADGHTDIAMIPNGYGSANIQLYTFAPNERTTVANGRALQRLTWTIGYVPETHGAFDIAAGDMNGDGDDELVISAKKGRGGHVQTFDYLPENEKLELSHSFFPYDESYFGGVYVHMADVDGDGTDELITSPQSGSLPNTRVYSFVGRNNVGWALDDWFWAFDQLARIGAYIST